MEIEKIRNLHNSARSIFKSYRREKEKRPYGANIMYELRAGENAHSRILKLLLQYPGKGDYPVYSSFLRMLNNIAVADFHIENPRFSNEEGRIDILIKDTDFAIIIENKVCGAVDQESQIKRYIDTVIKKNIPKDNIYVIYLTRDGTKTVSDYSLTDDAKEVLNITDKDTGRFIPVDYLNHILPWLEADLLPNLPIKEDLLISSVKLYIDYTKGFLGIREDEQLIKRVLMKEMKEALAVKGFSESIRIFHEAELFRKIAEELYKHEISILLEEKFYRAIQDKFPDYNIKRGDIFLDKFTFEFYGNWEDKCKITLAWENNKSYFGIYCSDKSLSAKLSESLSTLPGCGKSANDWPWWKWLNDAIPYADREEIWENIDSVCNFFIQFIQNTIDIIETQMDRQHHP